jgi:hypothetical protein
MAAAGLTLTMSVVGFSGAAGAAHPAASVKHGTWTFEVTSDDGTEVLKFKAHTFTDITYGDTGTYSASGAAITVTWANGSWSGSTFDGACIDGNGGSSPYYKGTMNFPDGSSAAELGPTNKGAKGCKPAGGTSG